MEIGIIGATGKAGRLIAKEAGRRGHHITAIVRDRSKVKNPDWDILESDIFDLTAEKLEGFHVVVDAFGTPYGKGLEFQHQTSMLTLINALENLSGVRLMVVGGAGSLYTDSDRKTKVVDQAPPMDQAVSVHMARAFAFLKDSRVNWTYFSPARDFDPAGSGTGTYQLGTDYVILNEEGKSYLSYRDSALAMVDEIENGRFIRKQFTAVSGRNIAVENFTIRTKKMEFISRMIHGIKNWKIP